MMNVAKCPTGLLWQQLCSNTCELTVDAFENCQCSIVSWLFAIQVTRAIKGARMC